MKSKRFYYTKKITEVFLEHGINTLTIDEVAEEIGVTKKTLYNYFDSKHQMVESFLDYLSMNQKKEVSNLLLNSKNPIDALIGMSKSLYNMSRQFHNRIRAELLPRYEGSIVKILEKRREEIYEYISFNFNKGINLGLFDSNLDISLWCKFYIYELESLFLMNKRVKDGTFSNGDIDHIMYYQIKGMCTQQGQEYLRRMVDFKVDLDRQA